MEKQAQRRARTEPSPCSARLAWRYARRTLRCQPFSAGACGATAWVAVPSALATVTTCANSTVVEALR